MMNLEVSKDLAIFLWISGQYALKNDLKIIVDSKTRLLKLSEKLERASILLVKRAYIE